MIATKGFGDTEMDFLPMTKISVKGNQKGLVSLAFAALLTTVSSAQAYDSYQLKVLFTPTKSDIEAEAKGRVMIYDGLKNETVEEALNAQFGRIDRMMFLFVPNLSRKMVNMRLRRNAINPSGINRPRLTANEENQA
jgi:hypothetical protein